LLNQVQTSLYSAACRRFAAWPGRGLSQSDRFLADRRVEVQRALDPRFRRLCPTNHFAQWNDVPSTEQVADYAPLRTREEDISAIIRTMDDVAGVGSSRDGTDLPTGPQS
jgi:hypothetical protein